MPPLVFSIFTNACNAEPEVSVDNEIKDGDSVGIELTTQVNDFFKGFEGDDKKNSSSIMKVK
ncbi:hypothetical protein [Paenisporosarcina antarctica]|uniref:Uncharacterized protein n=1 Tax=Paenisporosarcina antarctica TaxID=417367 RepID=A0A4P6ZYX8_9BACL|nr:hypothetical protein [Paenisporosarcina antarctica]QBP41309.1 hypothetical protein E2636_09275 [Paenisporosarcina antarctica]